MELITALLLVISVGLPASGQTVVGRISGNVHDSAGASKPNVTITVTNTATNLVRTGTADENGFYTITNLPCRNLQIEAEQKG